MPEIRQTAVFARWSAACGMAGRNTHPARIVAGIANLQAIVRAGVFAPGRLAAADQRYGPGYRVYFVGRGEALVILLAGGDKRTQDKDIARAVELAREV